MMEPVFIIQVLLTAAHVYHVWKLHPGNSPEALSDYPWARQQMVFLKFAAQERIKLLNSWMRWIKGWELLIIGHPIQSNSGNCLSIGNLQITCTWELFLVPEVSWKSQGASEEADYKITVPGSVSAHSLSRPSVGLGFIPGFVLLRRKPRSGTPKLILQLLEVEYFYFLNFQSQSSDF